MGQIVTVYRGEDGESHFLDVTADQFAEILKHIGEGPTTLNRRSPQVVRDYHNVGRVQYVVLLSGSVEVEVADRTVKLMRPGDVVIAQDTEGHGHITRGVGNEEWVYLAAPLEKGPWLPGGA